MRATSSAMGGFTAAQAAHKLTSPNADEKTPCTGQKKAALRQLSECPPEFANFVEKPPGWLFNVSAFFVPQPSIVVTATPVMSGKAGVLAIPQVEEMGGFLEGKRRPLDISQVFCAVRGNSTMKAAPPPGRASQRTEPPWRSLMDLTSDSPKPTPPSRSLAPGRR